MVLLVRKTLMIAAATAFGALLVAFLFFQELIHRAQARDIGGNECNDGKLDAKETKTNPNKSLFVSCGGFLE